MQIVRKLAYLCAILLLSFAWIASASEYHGRVLYAGLPVPGATVTITDGTKTFSTATDVQGLYEFPDVPDGAWTIRIEMSGFIPREDKFTLAPNAPQGAWEIKLQSADQLIAEAHAPEAETAPLLQRTPGAKPAKKQAATKPEQASAAEAPPADSDAPSERSKDGLLINGSENNASTSPFTLSPAFGNKHPGLKSLYTGSFGVIADNSVFDARPYSLTGLEVPKDSYNRVTFLATLGGPIRIPHLLYHGPNFFVAYQWTRDRDATTTSALVPDQAEREGDFSGILNPIGQPITIYDPNTGLPLPNETVPTLSGCTAPQTCIQPQAVVLLNYYPLPNLAGNSRYNYETGLLSNTHEDALESRLDKGIGHRDEFYGGFGFQSVRGDSENLFKDSIRMRTGSIDSAARYSR
jgi:hypothetical protein